MFAIVRLWLGACRLLQLALMTLHGWLCRWLASLQGSLPGLSACSWLASALLSSSDKSIDVRAVLGSLRGWYRVMTAPVSPMAALCMSLPLQMTT